MDWLEYTTESSPATEAPAGARPGPPQLPGLPNIPPMPVASAEAPAPTNKTIEVEPQWLELVEERRAKKPAAPAAKKERARVSPADAARTRPRIRPIIPREDE